MYFRIDADCRPHWRSHNHRIASKWPPIEDNISILAAIHTAIARKIPNRKLTRTIAHIPMAKRLINLAQNIRRTDGKFNEIIRECCLAAHRCGYCRCQSNPFRCAVCFIVNAIWYNLRKYAMILFTFAVAYFHGSTSLGRSVRKPLPEHCVEMVTLDRQSRGHRPRSV